MARRLLAILLATVVAVLLVTPAFADDLGVQSVDTSSWPQVKLTVTVPSSAKGAVPSAVRVWENDVEVPGAQIQSLASAHEKVDVVLVMDTSGSMKGVPLADAKAAAQRFVSMMGPQDRVAVVSFGSRPIMQSGFTGTRALLDSAISRLAAGGDTALYDGITSGLGLFTGDTTPRKAMVVLSDGKDTVSSTDLNTAVNEARSAGVPVYVVALKSVDYAPQPLQTIASATGGRLVNTAQSSSLGTIFGQLATELQTAYRIVFTSKQPNTPQLEIRTAVEGATVPLGKTVSFANPVFQLPPKPYEPPAPPSGAEAFWRALLVFILIIAIGVSVGVIAYIGLAALARGRRPIDDLGAYDRARIGGASGQASAARGASRSRLLGWVDDISQRRGYADEARKLLGRAGLPLRPSEYILFHFAGVLVIGLLAQIVLHNLLITTVAVIVAVAAPLYALDVMANRRRAAFEEQLPDILTLMSGSLRAGWGVQQSIDLVVHEAGEPAVTEFRRVQSEVRLGLSLDQALKRVAERLDSEDFRWVANAMVLQREVGGNLSEVLDTLASSVRERGELQREVKALTAEGRFSAAILLVLPFVLAIVLYFINPTYISLLFTTTVGRMSLVAGGILLVIGMIWMRRVVRIDV